MANIFIFNIFFLFFCFLAILLASQQPVTGMKRQRDNGGGPADPNDHQQSVKGGSSSVPEIPAQQEGPRIVYIEEPKKITVDAADFKPIVQRLTVNSEHQQEANVNNSEQGMMSSHGRPLTMGSANQPPLPPPPSLPPQQQFGPFVPPPSSTNINIVDRGKSIVSFPSIHHNQPASSLFSQLQRQQRLLHTTNSAMFSSADQQPFNQHVMQQQQQQIGDQQIHKHHLQQQNRQQQQQFSPFMPPPPPSTNINSVDRGKSIVSVPPIHNKQPEFSLFSQYLQQQQQLHNNKNPTMFSSSSPDKQPLNQQVMQQQQHFIGGEQQLLAQQHHHPYQLQQNPIHRPTRAEQQQQQQPFQPLQNPHSASTLSTRHTLLSLQQQSAAIDQSQQLASSMLHASKAAGPAFVPLAQRMLHIEPSHHLMFLLPNFKEDGSGSSAVEDKFIELKNRSGQHSLMFKLSSTNNKIFHFSISLPFHPADQFRPSPVGLQYRPSSSVGLLEPGQTCFVRVRLVLPTQNAANFAVHLYENMNNLEKKSHHRISIYHRVIENNNNDDIALSALEQWKGIDDERVLKWELAVLYEKKKNNVA